MASGLQMDSGVLLTTGEYVLWNGGDDDFDEEEKEKVWNAQGDQDLETRVSGRLTRDAAVIEFDLFCQHSQLEFEYQFGSEEYDEYVGQFNDGFMVTVDGVLVSFVPDCSGIVAVNSVGDGPPSNTTTATPLGPIGTPTPQATAGDAHVSLTWPQPATGGHSIGGYVVKYREAGSATWTDFGQVSGRSATVTHLKNGTKYEFGVTAVATDGATSSIGTTTATPSAPSKPIGTPKVTATAGNSEVALTWTEPDLGGQTLKNYTVLQRQIGETVWTTVGTTKKNTATVTGLTNGVKYEFAVIVTTTNGATSAPGIATAKPHADKKLKTTLKVKARPKAKKLPLGDRTKVVKKVKTNGLIKKVKLTCSLQGHALKGKNKRHMCTTKKKINTSRTNARVWLTPKCSTGLKVQVRIVAKLPGAKKRTWQRSYRPKKHPRTVCSLHGNG